MKKITFCSFVVASMLLLSACSEGGPSTSTISGTKSQQVTTGINIQTPGGEGTASELDTDVAVTGTQAPAQLYTDEDLSFYNGALQLQDATYCEKISGSDLKEKCKTMIANQKIIDQAVVASDPKICEQLQGNDVDSCKMQVDLAMKSNDDMRDPTSEEKQIMIQAQTAKDPSICDQIKSESKRQNCKLNVAAAME